VPELESLVSVAAATTLLSWLRSAARVGRGDAANAPTDPFHLDLQEQPMSSGIERDVAADDDGIVWQEFSVGDDGQIVQTTAEATSNGGSGNGDVRSTGDRVEREVVAERRRSARPRRAAPASGDPVSHVQAALRTYVSGLTSSGFTVDPWALAPAGHVPTAFDLERQSADVTASYLRAANGIGSLTDVYGSYARLLGSIAQLVEQHLAHVRRIEQLASTARSAPARGGSADHLYRQFVAATRDAWTRVEPEDLSPEDLATINEVIAEAAALHQAVVGRPAGRPR
jgi:hypothetical protein